MYRIAIVEDELDAMKELQGMVGRFFNEAGVEIEVSCFANAMRFLETYRRGFSLVFMDIEMPVIDGMEVARRLRKVDDRTALVFVTNLASLATNGYEVNALDFIVKPLDYELFAIKMRRIMHFVRRSASTTTMVRTADGMRVLRLDSIRYIEVSGHNLFFHTDEEVVKTRGALKDVVSELGDESFALCNKCYFVNLARVESMDRTEVTVGGERIQVSRMRRSSFLKALSDFHAGRKLDAPEIE